jgi:hypothetical protein
MPSSGMWRRLYLVWTDVSEELIASIFRVKTSVHTRSTRRHIPEDGILHSHRREKLESYKIGIDWYVANRSYKCSVWDSHSNGYEGLCLLGYNAMHSVERQMTFRRNMSLPSSGLKLVPCLSYSSTLKMEVTDSKHSLLNTRLMLASCLG